jgi:hypothetical protein
MLVIDGQLCEDGQRNVVQQYAIERIRTAIAAVDERVLSHTSKPFPAG